MKRYRIKTGKKLLFRFNEEGILIETKHVSKSVVGGKFETELVPDIRFTVPQFVKGKWIDNQPERSLVNLKNLKHMEILKGLANYLDQGVTFNKKLFYCSERALNIYSEALQLGLDKGLTKGKVDGPTGRISISGESLEKVIKLIRARLYNGQAKLTYYRASISKARSLNGVETIVWEDTYTGKK